jgi:hypothetical protein
MSQRIEDFPMWKVGGSFASVALLALLFGAYGIALIFALIGAGLLVGALVAKHRNRGSAQRL